MRKVQVKNISNVPKLKGEYFDLFKLYSLTNGQPGIIKEMIDVFIGQVNEYHSSISLAVLESNWQSIQKSTHKFKSSFSIMGMEQMIEHLESIIVHAKNKNKIEDIKYHVGVIEAFCSKCMEELKDLKNTI